MRKVLIVDDDPAVAGLVKEILLEEGFLAIHAGDADSGWASLLTEDPDAAILDLWLYGREAGWDLLDRIRANEHFQSLPVVILTGVTGTEVSNRAKEKGAEYLSKPFSGPALVDRLRRAMRATGRAPMTRGHDVVLLTPVFQIEGTIHVSDELERFSDAWEALVRDPRAYFPLTGATIKGLESDMTIAQQGLVEIRKADVTAVFPSEG
ncbi:MAG TPA: response regulator [Actinomycetota bacterium]|nr:response regulator [Actinomycetota bacterium]